MAGQARRIVQHPHHQVPTPAIRLGHQRHRVLRAIECGGGGGLAHGADPGRDVVLHGDHRLDQRARPGGEADAPAGHGVGLADAAHRQRPLPQPRLDGGHGGVLEAVEHQMLVHVVRHDPHMRVAEQHLGQAVHLGLGIGGAGWVVGAVQDHPFGAGRDGGVKVFGAEAKAVILRAVHYHCLAANQPGHERVSAPIRGWDDHLVSIIQRRQQGVVDDLLAAVADRDLVQSKVEAGIPLELALDGLFQGGLAVIGWVFGVAAKCSLVGGLDRMGRTCEIRLTDREGDHWNALGAEGTGAVGHGDGGRQGRTGQALG